MITKTSLSTNDKRKCDLCNSKAMHEINFFNSNTNKDITIILCSDCVEELGQEL